MNRRGFFGMIAGAIAALAVPVLAAGEKLREDQLSRFISARFVTRSVNLNEDWMARVEQTEDVTIGDAYFCSVVTAKELAACSAQVRRIACDIAGHDRIELLYLPKDEKSDALNNAAYISWKATHPVVGWRERYTRGNRLIDPNWIVRATA